MARFVILSVVPFAIVITVAFAPAKASFPHRIPEKKHLSFTSKTRVKIPLGSPPFRSAGSSAFSQTSPRQPKGAGAFPLRMFHRSSRGLFENRENAGFLYKARRFQGGGPQGFPTQKSVRIVQKDGVCDFSNNPES
ncbi:hypothetical protein [Neglectibacter caecimuris]|uniref:hypothetical protein n=1 Tax=Neglectibacter caecimuris TaxID=3093658 RepID=UPI002AC90398|nr:hypothetical protein [Neglectibacter sp. M00184]